MVRGESMRLGKISDSILKRTVLKHIKKNRKEVLNGAGIGEDCAIFSCENTNIATCVTQYTLTDGRDMWRAVHKAANNLVTSGAQPMAVMLSILLPEKASEEKLRKLMEGASQAATELKIQIAGGHTAVSKYVTQKLVTVTAYGTLAGEEYHTTKGAMPGQDIIMTKWIGLEGTAILAQKKREELLTRYPQYLVDEAIAFDRYLSVIPEAATAMKSGVCVMHDASEGGILATLWELAESSGVGLQIDLKKLPIRQETVEVCEFCDVNPYELLGGGCLVMTAQDGEGLVETLREQNIPAVIVGKITDNNDRLIYNGEEKRFLDKPKTDEIYRFL